MNKKYTLTISFLFFSILLQATVTSGSCGANLQWSFRQSDSTLIITGYGPMDDYTSSYYTHQWGPNNLRIKHIILPEGLTRIGKYAFCYCNEVKELRVPDSVREIAQGALNSMTAMKKLTLGAQLKVIRDQAFTAVQVDTLVSTATFDGWCSTSMTQNGGQVNVKNALIIDGQQVSGDFYIPSTVHKINDYVFAFRPGVSAMHIPASVDTIGNPFGIYWEDGDTLYYEGTLSQWCSMVHTNALFTSYQLSISGTVMSNIVLPEGMTQIGAYLFSGAGSIEYVTIPASVTVIGERAFAYCRKLKGVFGGQNVRQFQDYCLSSPGLGSYSIPRQTRYIGDYAFSGTSFLNNTVRLDSLIHLGEYAFYGSRIDSIILPDGLSAIGDAAFYICPNLRYVRLPDGIKQIPAYCFWKDTALYAINIPDGVERFEKGSFTNAGLREITIPQSVQVIGDVALSMDSLQRIVSMPTTPPACGAYAFSTSSYSIPVEVPCASLGAYRNANEWSKLTNYITTSVGASSFGSNNDDWGTVSIQQNCAHIELTAIPKEHYHFVRWSDGQTANPYSFTQTSDTVVNAIFDIDHFRVTFLNSDSSVLEIDSIAYNTPALFMGGIPQHPSAPEQYLFYDWTPKLGLITQDTCYKALYTDLSIHYAGLCLHAIQPTILYWNKNNYYSDGPHVQCSRDGQHWENFNSLIPAMILAGDSLFFRGFNSSDIFNGIFVTVGGAIMASGSIMSLIDTTLTRTDVPDGAFEGVFSSCLALYTAPELPATTLGSRCYKDLFKGCKNLRAAPFLPATNLGDGCYNQMFSGCDSLRYVEVAFSDWVNENGNTFSDNWLTGVAANGVFVLPDSLAPIEDDSHIPNGWITSFDTVTYSISAKADHGRIVGTGTYHSGFPITVAVIPDLGHYFLAWHTGAVANPLFTTVTENAAYFAFCPADTVQIADTTDVYVSDDAALICWQMVDSATSYLLTCYKNGEEFVSDYLDVYGQSIDSGDDRQTSYAPLRTKAAANLSLQNASSPLVLYYYLDNIEKDILYTYSVAAYQGETLLTTISGEFRVPVSRESDIVNVTTTPEQAPYKIFSNHMIFIVRDGKTYTLTGIKIK